MSIPSSHEMTMIRGFISDLLVDTAVVRRNRATGMDDEPAPGYRPQPEPEVVKTIRCRFPVPIAGSVLGFVYRAERDLVQRRYGMLVEPDEDILEGDVLDDIIDLTGRKLNIQPMRVDAVVLRSSQALVVLEEYS